MSARTLGWLFWLVVGGLAALALFWQIGHPPQPPIVRSAGPPPELPTVVPLEPFRLSPPAQYSEVAARPLFIAERRPEPPPPPDETPPEKPQPGSEQKFVLLGVMIAPGIQAALLRLEEPNAKTKPVRLGETVGEWRLDKVAPNEVVLRRGEATQNVKLMRPREPAGKPRAKRKGVPAQDAAPPARAPAPSAAAPIGPGGMPVVPVPVEQQPAVSAPPAVPVPPQ